MEERYSMEVGDTREATVREFLTEQHDRLAIEFRFTYDAQDVQFPDGTVDPVGELELEGRAAFNTDSGTIGDLQLTAASVVGETTGKIARTHYGSVHDSVGARLIPYTLHKSLSLDD